MTEVLIDNFEELYPRVEAAIRRAKVVALDTEFSALYVDDAQKPSLFDTVEQRYAKVGRTAGLIRPLQVGLTAFEFDPEKGNYVGDTFTFYVWPRPVMTVNQTMVFKASSFQFLGSHNFDFNKLIYRGLPFLNRSEEAVLKKRLHPNCTAPTRDMDVEHHIETVVAKISTWFYTSKTGDVLKIDDLGQSFWNNIEGTYILQKHVRNRFQNELWTSVENARLVVTKVTTEEFASRAKTSDLETATLRSALGFTRIFRLLVEHGKPIVGHNVFMDLLLLYNTFEDPLPKGYAEMKRVLHETFPMVYDTKTISFEVSRTVEKNKLWKHNTLGDLYDYFKDQQGRHLAFNSPLINTKVSTKEDHFHDAGWDSYCTGYIFVRMAHYLATKDYKVQDRVLTSTEHLAALEDLANCVNLIRCSVSYINLGGDDPRSRRPSCLMAVANERKNLDIPQLTSLLSTCGYVEVRTFGPKRAIIAVDNHRRTGAIVTGSMLLYLAHNTIRK